jgi:SNF2 family DNA or RNA helicase
MNVLHAFYQPPLKAEDPGGMFFWLETSDVPQPAPRLGRAAHLPKPRPHPFTAPSGLKGERRAVGMLLPSVKGIPLPSPQLVHNWAFDVAEPSLAPFLVDGVWMQPPAALSVLLAFSASSANPGDSTLLAADFQYWNMAAALALETLAAHKLVPVLDGKCARWLPVLDSPSDAQRISRLVAAMPAVCRAAGVDGAEPPSPRSLLTGFLNAFCDALARAWALPAAIKAPRADPTPAYRWLEALFGETPLVQATPNQLQTLQAGFRAWMRNLHVSGDAAFRIAFRLEAPAAQPDPWQLHYLIQAKDDPSLLISADEVWEKTRGALTALGHRFEQPQEKLLAGLGYAARLFPRITESLKSKRPTSLAVDTGGAYTFLRETAPLLEGAGFGILVPPWWNKKGARLGVKVKLKAKNDAVAAGRMSLEGLVNYQWRLSLGDTELSEEEFAALARLKLPLVQIRGQWVTLDGEQIEAAIHFWEHQQREGEMSMLEAIRVGLGGETAAGGLPIDAVDCDGWLAEWLDRLSGSEKLEQLPQPAGLHAQLRPYQGHGFSWLAFMRRAGLGACLADDMGLGKTIQTISLFVREKELAGPLPTPALLIAPTSVVTNWEREMTRFAPGLRAYIHRGADRLRGAAFREAIQGQDVVLTSYPVARLDAESIQSVHWQAVVLDEAQNIKNPDAKQTQAINRLNAGYRIALTGTPVENRLSELWSIMHFLNPGYLGGRKAFRESFALPIERYHDETALAQLKQLTTPFILRRVKTDPRVITDLPEKVETKEYCTLTEEQATLYEAAVQNSLQRIETEAGIERRGLVLSMLMQLKQICNHPVQYLHQSGKTGVDAALANRSGKLERLGELLEEILAEGERTLIFTQFAEMGKLLADYLPGAFGAPALFLHGGTPAKARDAMVRRFQEEDHAPPVFILSLKAGGTGLNLTRANHVFHFDRWWNPAVEDQATDRAFRIGQKRNVQVHKFVTTGTLEEMIDDMIESKKGLAQAVVGSGENWLTELSTDELRSLVALRRE